MITLTKYTFEEVEVGLVNAVYAAATLWYERAECAKLIRGNGHHMAQELVEVAVQRLNERKI